MIIKSIKLSLLKRIFLFLFIILLAFSILLFCVFNKSCFFNSSSDIDSLNNVLSSNTIGENFMNQISNISTNELAEDSNTSNSYNAVKFNWIELMAYLGCKYGGDFSLFKQSDLDELVSSLREGKTMESITSNMKLYNYFYQSYDAIFHEYIGEYEIATTDDTGNIKYVKKYGLKAFLPIAKGYSFSHYKDFGTSRSYGYRRLHLGNDLLGSIGTPIIAVESGYVEALGWNQYGGWRIGIRSFDGKRYYYYAHLRKDHPYAKDLCEGQIVNAGDVIGYLGMTGYSSKENVNNINIPHLHFGLQLIFNEVQKDGINQIWIDVYEIIDFLRKNASQVYVAHSDTKDYERKYDMMTND